MENKNTRFCSIQAPIITNPGGTASVPDTLTGTQVFKTLAFEAFDAADATCSMTSNDGGPFDVISS